MIWIAILGTATVSLGFRVSMLLAAEGHRIPARLDQALQGVAPAVIAAILAVEVSARGAGGRIDVAYVAASVTALIVVRRTGQLTHGAAMGLAIVWIAAAVA